MLIYGTCAFIGHRSGDVSSHRLLIQVTIFFSPLLVVKKAYGETVALWSSRDALVIKMLTGVLEKQLPVHPLCEHIRDHAGGRQSTTSSTGMSQTLCCVICWGSFCTTTWKTPAHSTLSPQLAAFHLYNVDTRMAIHHPRVRYIRYMDDVLLLAPTRWVLRRAVRDLKHELEDYGFTLHPDKTRFGYTERDFDWMRLWFTESGVQTFAPRTISKHREQWSRALLLPLDRESETAGFAGRIRTGTQRQPLLYIHHSFSSGFPA